MRRHIPSADLFLYRTLSRFPNHEIVEEVGKGSNGRVFRARNAVTQNDLAFKVVPVSNIPSDPTERDAYLNEAKASNTVQHRSVVRYLDVFTCDEIETDTPCIVFACDYVDGPNLRDYVKHHSESVTVPLVETFLRTMFELLFELEQRRIVHGDLHPGNVLVETPRYDVYAQPRFRVTDFCIGSLDGHPDAANDYLDLGRILTWLLRRIDYATCQGRDRFVFEVLRSDFAGRHLLERTRTIDPVAVNPRALLEKLDRIGDEYDKARRNPETRLRSPFDYPNCEQIGNSHLVLKSLYSNRLLGLPEIEKRSNLILTGPRGCGKTTVFRALSLDYRAATDDDDPSSLSYVGIYYRCHDLYFAFPRYTLPNREDAFDIPVHYFTSVLLASALEQIQTWARRHFRDEYGRKERKLTQALWSLLDLTPPSDPSAASLNTLIGRLKGKETERAARKQRFANVPAERIEGYFGPQVLFSACSMIRDQLGFLQERPFYFFVDDYSDPKITRHLQMNLNRVVMHRSADVFFKLSTESPISFVREDLDGKKYVESREYDLVNLGLRYISSKGRQALDFLEDLFERRFGEVDDYPVRNLHELLGSSSVSENQRARDFREKQGRDSYAGVETVGAMCSGDIHYMIRLVGTMVEDCGGQEALTSGEEAPRIAPRQQHASIRAAAGGFMEAVRTLPRCGQQLADIVSAFGNVAYSYMLHRDSRNERGRPPHQATRIEPFEPVRVSEVAREILNELLRYSILIEDPRGKSRRGQIVPRFYLRRYLIPHFRLTFSRRDSLELENNELEALLCRPGEFEDEKRLRQDQKLPGRGLFDGQ